VIGRAWWVPWLWLAPTLTLLGVFLIYPSVDTLRRSFLDARSDEWVGLGNYEFIVDNPNPLATDTHSALLNNMLWLTLFTVACVGLGLVMAVITARVRYEAAAKAAIFVPMAISFVAVSVIWRFMYEINPDVGTVNAVFNEIGKDPVAWLNNTDSPQQPFVDFGPETAPKPFQVNNFALIAVGVWNWVGFTLVGGRSCGRSQRMADLLPHHRPDHVAHDRRRLDNPCDSDVEDVRPRLGHDRRSLQDGCGRDTLLQGGVRLP
jgi:alpha-glucoside transport system permease protein